MRRRVKTAATIVERCDQQALRLFVCDRRKKVAQRRTAKPQPLAIFG